MQDVSYTPKRQNAIPVTVITGAAALCVACAVFLMLQIGNALLFQTLFLVAAIVMVYFFTRYLSASYTYTVSEENNLFVVTKRVGKRLTTLCRLDLSALYRVRLYEEDDDTERRHADRYSYCVSLRPAITYLAFFDDGEHIVSIRMELDDAFYTLLNGIAERNTARPRDTEEDEEY